jgi:hypothetical protein
MPGPGAGQLGPGSQALLQPAPGPAPLEQPLGPARAGCSGGSFDRVLGGGRFGRFSDRLMWTQDFDFDLFPNTLNLPGSVI